ncbi:MAG: PSD1 and planctomycete cytochrome C domain-containing protein [Isosphaeraceae bacterium]|nr:PSD1 and planctomycete cytochrome C domain-containing protein [Isosphaeraceae bacterium]
MLPARSPRLPWALLGLLCVVPYLARAEPPGPKPVSFVRDVRPILARHCFACHGPDSAKRKAKLRLDTKDGALGEYDGVRRITPGSLDDSEVYLRITSNDSDERMPPGKDNTRLTPEQIETLKRWIEQGAKWESHWAFEKPVQAPLPAVRDGAWCRNPIDRFVLARLDAEGLRPSPEADRATLIRRVSLDLTGVPPTPESVERYLADRAPDAYERLVERLLQSPAFGERWARLWLDQARYADTKGYEKDQRRSIWRFRDWVINAFNCDMPYDRFTVEQLAGDLLLNATPDQVLATAFHRNTLVNDEGGTDDEEFRVAAVKDRVDTTGQVWLGLTLGCAKCHSHKYDPIAQNEYYQLYAFFNQTEDSDKADDRPTAPFPAREQQQRHDQIFGRIQSLESALRTPTPAATAAFERWQSAQSARPGWSVVIPATMDAKSGSPLKGLPDGSILVGGTGTPPAKETYTVSLKTGATTLRALRLEAIPDPSLPRGGVGRSVGDGNFVLSGISLTVRPRGGLTRELKFASAAADFAQGGYPIDHALANPDVKKHGWAVSPEVAKPHQALFRLADPVALEEGDELVVRLDHEFEFAYPGFSLGRFRLSVTDDAGANLTTGLPEPLALVLRTPAGERTPAQKQALWDHFAASAPETKSIRDELAGLRSERDVLLNAARTPIFRELPAGQRRQTRLHKRGNFLDPGDMVEPGTPARFAPLPSGAPRDRLGLARWIVDPGNPLTARVAVNRHWAQFFGRGLVETQEDFGSQGQPPSHPELLDWLAVDLRYGGWSLKRLCRLIVTSATYRQSSRVAPELLKKDRFNRLLARGPRYRMEAEMVRDAALAAAGLLSARMYGPSVMPYQPDGIWKSTYSSDNWVTSPGNERHRRGLYTFLKRTSPYPAMMVFDAPSREVCTVRRISTNTPLQALVTLNDQVYIEAAQALARRASREAGPSVEGRIARALQLALIRPAETREVSALVELYRKRLEFYRKDGRAAHELAANPLGPVPAGSDEADLAALTSVCNVILNLDEFLTRG